ncbi:MAG: hypothetical protein AB200_02800 [Parcubacteria bacterium C7867-005]|nr:MAG: hypothetical protein AB200_02800 [Parcubacteria bacterium C7867-005]
MASLAIAAAGTDFTGRHSFRRCEPCNLHTRHGHYFDPEGMPASGPYTSQSQAIEHLEKNLRAGRIPLKDKAAIENDIRSSGLPHRTSLDEVKGIRAIIVILAPAVSPQKSSYEFLMADGDPPKSAILKNDQVVEGTEANTKAGAREALYRLVNRGEIGPQDEQKILDQIETSTMPDSAPIPR